MAFGRAPPLSKVHKAFRRSSTYRLLQIIFEKYDSDRSGHVDLKELRNVQNGDVFSPFLHRQSVDRVPFGPQYERCRVSCSHAHFRQRFKWKNHLRRISSKNCIHSNKITSIIIKKNIGLVEARPVAFCYTSANRRRRKKIRKRNFIFQGPPHKRNPINSNSKSHFSITTRTCPANWTAKNSSPFSKASLVPATNLVPLTTHSKP